MNKKIIMVIAFILFSINVSAQLRDSIWWNTPYFEIVYSEVLEQPKWVHYRVACPNGNADRSGMDFYKEVGIKTSDKNDYVANEWDKGHMAPAADFNCTHEMLLETFTYLNCALQHEKLNRGVWKYLEARERKLANEWMVVDITIRVVFDKNPNTVLGGASIPKGFYKTIKYSNIIETYYFPNEVPTSKDYNDYRLLNVSEK